MSDDSFQGIREKDYQKHLRELSHASLVVQEIYLSLRGNEAWRMYCEGMNRALLIDMFAHANHYNALQDGLYDVLKRFTRAPGYDTRGTALLKDFTLQQKRLSESNINKFDAMNHFSKFMGYTEMKGIIGSKVDDARTPMVNWLGSFMINRVYISSREKDFTEAMTALWFEVCDTALEAAAG